MNNPFSLDGITNSMKHLKEDRVADPDLPNDMIGFTFFWRDNKPIAMLFTEQDRDLYLRVIGHGVVGLAASGVILVSEEYRSEEHTSELQSLRHLVCRLLL